VQGGWDCGVWGSVRLLNGECAASVVSFEMDLLEVLPLSRTMRIEITNG
jgi:hypothetical protein